MRTGYRVDNYQQTYFVIDSFDQLFKETYADFSKLYEEIKQDKTEYAPDDIAPNDTVITKGTQDYAKSKQ